MHTKTDAKDYGILEQKVTALRLFKKFPGLKEQFWKESSGLQIIISELREQSHQKQLKSILT